MLVAPISRAPTRARQLGVCFQIQYYPFFLLRILKICVSYPRAEFCTQQLSGEVISSMRLKLRLISMRLCPHMAQNRQELKQWGRIPYLPSPMHPIEKTGSPVVSLVPGFAKELHERQIVLRPTSAGHNACTSAGKFRLSPKVLFYISCMYAEVYIISG